MNTLSQTPCSSELFTQKFSGIVKTSKVLIQTFPRVVMVVPIIAKRFEDTVQILQEWGNNNFDIELVVTEGEKNSIAAILEEHDLRLKINTYTPDSCPNAGIAKNAAYAVVKRYIDDPNFSFAVLVDDTVNDIINTKSATSIMKSPLEFCQAVGGFANESPVFGGTVAHKRHPKKCAQGGLERVKGGFLQQAIFFSCRGTPTLKNTESYLIKMRGLSYRPVPFGEDVAFQISLYEHQVLRYKESAQFWGIGVLRMKHESATKPPFDKLDDNSKEALKNMLIYLNNQDALRFKVIAPGIAELTGVRVIPGGPIRITVNGKENERPWKAAHDFSFNLQ